MGLDQETLQGQGMTSLRTRQRLIERLTEGNDLIMVEADGTDTKRNFGANAILGVSLACAKAAASSMKINLHEYINNKASEFYDRKIEQKLPIPMLNILNGGAHADNPIDFQEFMIRPFGFNSFSDSLRCGVEIFHGSGLKSLLDKILTDERWDLKLIGMQIIRQINLEVSLAQPKKYLHH